MSSKSPSSDSAQASDGTSGGKRRFLGGLLSPQKDGSLFRIRSRSSSRSSRHKKSPDAKDSTKVDTIQSDSSHQVSTSTQVTPSKVNSGSSDPNLPTHKATTKPDNTDDIWALADQHLRKDPNKKQTLEKYDEILKQELGSALEPPGSEERKKQILKYLQSKTSQLDNPENETRLERFGTGAKSFFRSAVDCVIAAKDVINAAAAPCLPASVACAGVTFLLTVCLITQRFQCRVLISCRSASRLQTRGIFSSKA